MLEVKVDCSMMGIPTLATEPVGLDGEFDAEALQVDDDAEDQACGQEVHDVGQVLAVEGLLEGAGLVLAGEEKVDEGDDGALKLIAAARVDGSRRQCLPEDGLADVGGDEEVDAGTETVPLLEELVQEHGDKRGNHELDDQEEAHAGADFLGATVQTSQDGNGGVTKGDDHSEDWRKK
ncbi:hypothetical protein BC936DRAFT_146374 [Jimgerdemannia flammicorona]|uniref:Uncharacterized protein n=1 Tax=Jimgerdemannia flammicorona TaxID=994334 RepID=A0A433D7T7_9FUNG|nr:hypothetical protein BC936DRAFT_146374 [Jimgerdemannia flammicorona]